MSKVSDTLAQREKRYGKFSDNANTAQILKHELRMAKNWSELEYDQREALDLIMSKIGRMLSGDVNYIDSWHDIAGYATLIENRLDGEDQGDPRPKAPLNAVNMAVWDQYIVDLTSWYRRNPGMDT